MFTGKKTTTILMLLFVLLLALAACGGTAEEAADVSTEGEVAGGEADGESASEEITLLVWDQFTPDYGEEAILEMYESFEQAHPNINIEREVFEQDQLRTILKTALGSETGPDVVYNETGPGQSGVMARAGLLLPLEDYAAEHGWDERFFDLALRESTFDGTLYGLSNELEFIGMYYNKTLMEQEGLEIPQTMPAFLDFCREARDLGYVPTAYSQNPGWQAYHTFSVLAYNALGDEEMDALLFENEGSWEDPRIVDAIDTFFVDMAEAGCFVEDVNSILYDDGAALFYTGEALAFPTGTWLVGEIEANMPDYEVELVPLPALNEDGGRYYPVGAGSAWFISSGSDHQEAAAMLLDHLFSAESVPLWLEGRLVPPVPFDANQVDSELFAQVLETLQVAAAGDGDTSGPALGFFVNHAVPEQFNTQMRDGFQAVVAGLMTPEEMATSLQNAWDQGFGE